MLAFGPHVAVTSITLHSLQVRFDHFSTVILEGLLWGLMGELSVMTPFFVFLLSNGGSYDLVKVTQAKSHRGQQAISMCDTEHGMPLLHVQYINQFQLRNSFYADAWLHSALSNCWNNVIAVLLKLSQQRHLFEAGCKPVVFSSQTSATLAVIFISALQKSFSSVVQIFQLVFNAKTFFLNCFRMHFSSKELLNVS